MARMKSKYGFETTEQRSRLMGKIRGKDTRPEVEFRKLLWNAGVRYRKNDPSLPGKPDLVIRKHRLAVFIDGEFWHGYNWEEKKPRIGHNKEYWIPKIEKNIARDSDANDRLKYLGFKVLRFWESEIRKNPAQCFLKVMKAIEENNN